MPNVTNSPAMTSIPATSQQPDTLVGFQHNTTQFTYASPSGTTNDVNGGFPRFVGNVRLAVTLAAGNATWTGLGAGADGQHLILWNTDAANTLTLSVASSSSLSQNQFNGPSGSYVMIAGAAIELVYFAGLINAWVITQGANTGGGSSGTGGPVSATITTASTNNYNPGGGFPTGIGRLYINPSTNDIAFTGLVAGVDGQQVIWFNTGSTFNIILNNENASSTAANRFNGEGDAIVPPGGKLSIVYSTTLSRWSIG